MPRWTEEKQMKDSGLVDSVQDLPPPKRGFTRESRQPIYCLSICSPHPIHPDDQHQRTTLTVRQLVPVIWLIRIDHPAADCTHDPRLLHPVVTHFLTNENGVSTYFYLVLFFSLSLFIHLYIPLRCVALSVHTQTSSYQNISSK